MANIYCNVSATVSFYVNNPVLPVLPPNKKELRPRSHISIKETIRLSFQVLVPSIVISKLLLVDTLLNEHIPYDRLPVTSNETYYPSL